MQVATGGDRERVAFQRCDAEEDVQEVHMGVTGERFGWTYFAGVCISALMDLQDDCPTCGLRRDLRARRDGLLRWRRANGDRRR